MKSGLREFQAAGYTRGVPRRQHGPEVRKAALPCAGSASNTTGNRWTQRHSRSYTGPRGWAEMRVLAFTKMQGLGNDFVVLDARAGAIPLGLADRRRITDRRRGV